MRRTEKIRYVGSEERDNAIQCRSQCFHNSISTVILPNVKDEPRRELARRVQD
jgi:hypothetical protein